MVLHDHQTTIVRILCVLIGLFLTCRTLNDGLWRSFNFQSQVQFNNRQVHDERFNSLIIISPIKFHGGRELRKAQS